MQCRHTFRFEDSYPRFCTQCGEVEDTTDRGNLFNPGAESYISFGTKQPKYLYQCGSYDFDGGWDNGIKILEG